VRVSGFEGFLWEDLGGSAGLVAGKKTIIGGTLVMAGAVAGVWYGKLDPVTGLNGAGVGLSIAGFSAKANRHQASF